MFHRVALAVLIVLTCTSARAADTWNWSGFHVGAHAGVSSLDTDFRSDFGLVQPDTYNATPRSFGVHGGYGREVGALYVGVEGNFTAHQDTGVKDASIWGSGAVGGGVGGCIGAGCPPASVNQVSVERFDTELKSVASLKARVGYPVGRLLPFISAGMAAGASETRYLAATTVTQRWDSGRIEQTTNGHIVDDREIIFGYALGGGLEFAVNSRVSMRAEYVFTNLGNRIYEHPDGTVSESFETRLHEGRIGLSLRF